MKSMTGFGRAAATHEGSELTVQVSSVNRRGIEIIVALPDEWRELESAISERVRAVANRGRIAVTINCDSAARVEGLPDDTAVARVLDHLSDLAVQRRIEFRPDAQLLWQVVAGLRGARNLPAAETMRPRLIALLDRALGGFTAMRALEGTALLRDLTARVAILRQHLTGIAERAPIVPGLYRETLLRRLREAKLELDVSDERVLKEIALFADRCDISEEITRARSHLDQLDALLAADGEIGRKAEFILQELVREVNTSGSKSNDLTIAKLVIEAKNELERLREQIANVE
jgi:uncharacterized protein (TIGR00255 family)